MSTSSISAATKAESWAVGARVLIPAVWLGLIIGISFIEAPLKFTAPGITLPLGLGIGRLVFAAMNIVEIVLFLGLLLATVKRSVGRVWWWATGIIGVLLMLKVAVIRPGLSQRTDAVLAGNFEGGSLWHYAYIGVETVLTFVLIGTMLWAVKRWVRISPR